MKNIAIAINKNPGIIDLIGSCTKRTRDGLSYDILSGKELFSASMEILTGKNPRCKINCENGNICNKQFNKYKVSISGINSSSEDKNNLPNVGTIKSKSELYENLYGEENILTMSFKATSRIAVGLGNPSVHEVSLAWHPLYGYPYIPGEGLKGVVRRFYIQKKFQNSEKEACKDPKFKYLFGDKDRKGTLCFFDAIPLDVKLVRNVMNPHYSSYYSNKNAPGDNGRLSPVFYLVLEKESKFEIRLSINKTKRYFKDNDCMTDCLKDGKELLIKALEENGVGGKTTSAFGRLKFIPNNEKVLK